MIGYAFLDFDGKLNRRTQEYIEVDNPYFFGQNTKFIQRSWKFDTENDRNMTAMLKAFQDLRLNEAMILDFLRGFGYEIKDLKARLEAEK